MLALLIALPLGMYQAVHRNGAGDHLLTGASFTLYSMPDFFFAILLIALFSVQLHLLPPEAPQATSVGGILADPRALVLPVLTLALISVASYSRYMRSSAIDALAQDYIRVARAKGLPERLVLSRHVLRNSLLPIVTMVGLSLPDHRVRRGDRRGGVQLPGHGPAVLPRRDQPRLPGPAGLHADRRCGHGRRLGQPVPS